MWKHHWASHKKWHTQHHNTSQYNIPISITWSSLFGSFVATYREDFKEPSNIRKWGGLIAPATSLTQNFSKKKKSTLLELLFQTVLSTPTRNFCGRFTRGTFILKLRNKVKDLYSTSVQLKEVKLWLDYTGTGTALNETFLHIPYSAVKFDR